MKTVVIGGTKWTEQYPVRDRPRIIRMIYSLAANNGWHIVVAGQHWPK